MFPLITLTIHLCALFSFEKVGSTVDFNFNFELLFQGPETDLILIKCTKRLMKKHISTDTVSFLIIISLFFLTFYPSFLQQQLTIQKRTQVKRKQSQV